MLKPETIVHFLSGPDWLRGKLARVVSANLAAAGVEAHYIFETVRKFRIYESELREWEVKPCQPGVYSTPIVCTCDGGHVSRMEHQGYAISEESAASAVDDFCGLVDGSHPLYRTPDTEAGKAAVRDMHGCKYPDCGKPFRAVAGKPVISSVNLAEGVSRLVALDGSLVVAARLVVPKS